MRTRESITSPTSLSDGLGAPKSGALDEIEEDDVLVVTKLDRLARSTLDLLRIIDQIGREDAGFKSLGEPWADTTSAGRLMLTILSGIADDADTAIMRSLGSDAERTMRSPSMRLDIARAFAGLNSA